jgi:hypothetical protein
LKGEVMSEDENMVEEEDEEEPTPAVQEQPKES